MWPTCINNLSPIEVNFNQEIPEFLKKAFNKEGIFNEYEMFMPIRLVRILGNCSTLLYLDCPNIPNHHLDIVEDYMSYPDYDDDPEYYDQGRYHWFDFDLVGTEQGYLPLRMVFNEGDGDCNDGYWGAIWERNTEDIIANIICGNDISTVEAISEQHIDIYEFQEILIPRNFDNNIIKLNNGVSLHMAKNLKLEKFLILAIRFCDKLTYYEERIEYKKSKNHNSK
ncbi:MAG: hypothetical protein WBA93_32920 [Microcoleaceae cyanobacterium]